MRTAPQVSTEKAEPAARADQDGTGEVRGGSQGYASVARAESGSDESCARKSDWGHHSLFLAVYLQLSATDKDKADVMVDLLRSKKLPGLAAMVPENPKLYRVWLDRWRSPRSPT